ncbi:RNA polymerase sigma factor [Pseudomonas tohonis]|uniref:DNA-directed RNA polymerase sigma-70 factor n=1 Tax=Pseudomonas tohonis TaxID=2725477 RepID=A0A6J4E215_9PSED|nr:sigma-70 family RNA polymerase sigma factor [Pseudomonas tohonis]BCG23993.1 DNA-directed RNA polymerase sigma-70 factor [Pseudomonas tohonis]GJN56183.1 DNA-directed RNA polymerase sigma-70 factor [Pseudomonas tohonis]
MSKSSPFLALYLREQNRLLQLIRRIVGDRSTAEDLAQDTFLRLWDRELGDGDRSLLFRTAQNLALDHLRARQVRSRHAREQSDEDDTIDLQQQAEAHQEFEHLLRRLQGLPRRCQQVFLLSRVDGLSYASIAERLGVSLSTVEKDIIRVLQHCQRTEG